MLDIREQTISPHPWRVDGVELLCDEHEATSRIAELWGTDADAALMAKAPELLLALQETMSWILDELEAREDDTALFEKQLSLLDSLRVAGVVVKEKE